MGGEMPPPMATWRPEASGSCASCRPMAPAPRRRACRGSGPEPPTPVLPGAASARMRRGPCRPAATRRGVHRLRQPPRTAGRRWVGRRAAAAVAMGANRFPAAKDSGTVPKCTRATIFPSAPAPRAARRAPPSAISLAALPTACPSHKPATAARRALGAAAAAADTHVGRAEAAHPRCLPRPQPL